MTNYQQNNNFGTIPKWVWNVSLVEITKEEIYRQLNGFSKIDGYSGVMIVLWNIDGYMSEEYFEKYRYALEVAKELQLSIIIWDENGFPSGHAGGELERLYPEHTAKRLDKKEIVIFGGELVDYEIEQGFEGAVAFNKITKQKIDLSDYICNDRLQWRAPDGKWCVMQFYCVMSNIANGFFKPLRLVDYLDKNAVNKFIELTYEQYFSRFEDYFGSVIKYAFYDEPSFWHIEGGRIWTDRYKNKFMDKYGFSPVPLYPALWYDIGEDTAYARNMLFGLRAELYADEYIGTLADWCTNHQIQLTGHMDQEEITNPVSISGDLFKVFKHQHIPGVDEILNYGRGSSAYKIPSSAAVCYDKERVMCEVFGAMGEEMPTDVLLKEAIDMLARGINFFVPHGTWYSNAPDKVTFPPELSYRSEKFADSLAEYNRYVQNCCSWLTGGRQVTDIALLYPIHDLQAQFCFDEGDVYTGGVNPEYSDYLNIGEVLSLDIRHDFVFVHPEILDEKCSVKDNFLYLKNAVNFQKFKIIIIPGMEVISLSNLNKIFEFYNHGGVVIFTSKLPTRSSELQCDKEVCDLVSKIFKDTPNSNKNGGKAYFVPECNAEKLKSIFLHSGVSFDVTINTTSEIYGGNLSYIHKVKGNENLYFIGNSSDGCVEIEILLEGIRTPVIYDPNSNKKRTTTVDFISQNDFPFTRVRFRLSPIKSAFILSKT